MNWRVLLGVVLGAVAIVLAGCGDSGSAGGPSGAGSKMKVGLIVSGSTSDGGWNQLASESLQKLAKEEDIQPVVREQVSKDAAADAIRQLEANGCALVIAHGYEYLEAVKELTDPANPKAVKVKVAVSGGDVDSPNFESLNYDLSGASYQFGTIAGKVSKTGKLGFIGGEAVPTVTVMARGFEAGARSVNPKVTMVAQYTGWDDPSKAKKQAEAFIEQGVDVIMQDVDAASRGVFEAVAEYNGEHLRMKSPVYTFGANSEQNENPVCGKYTLASAVIRMELAFGRSLKAVKEGSFRGGLVREDLGNRVCEAVINPILVGNVIPRETVKDVLDAGKKLDAGEIKVPAEK